MLSGRDKLLEALGHSFARPELLDEALTHPSATTRKSTRRGEGRDYDRLEFLGDRVLGLVIADLLLKAYPEADAGRLARRYNELVRRETLADVAARLDLGSHIHFAWAERAAGGGAKPALLANACEAVIAALFLDGGIKVASAFIHRYWHSRAHELTTAPKDAKTRLQEWAHAFGSPTPIYTEVSRDGPPHDPVFTMEVSIKGVGAAEGRGGAKRASEQIAAETLFQMVAEKDAE
jgi:ribonuclease-3